MKVLSNTAVSLLSFILLGCATNQSQEFSSTEVTTANVDQSNGATCKPHDELAFFNSLNAQLEIELTEAAKPMSESLLNEVAPATARIVDVNLIAHAYIGEEYQLRELSTEELNQVAFDEGSILLMGDSGGVVKHLSSNSKFFTVKEMLEAVRLTEYKTRGDTDWFGGIDVHHIFFSGIECEKGIWVIIWDS